MEVLIFFSALLHLVELGHGMPLTNDKTQSDLLPNETAAGVIEIVNRAYPQLDLFEIDIPYVDKTIQSMMGDHAKPRQQDFAKMKGASVGSSLLWPNGRVPYSFAAFLTDDAINAAMLAMNHWMNHTCIHFVPLSDSDRDYILFVEYSGCWSFVGRQGGPQMLSLGDAAPAGQSCKAMGAVVHEIGHAVGLWHEQSRPDRDSYVRIQWANINPNAVVNFLTYSTSDVPSTTQYDYGSIMHYSNTAFSINGRPTIVPLQKGVNSMGQRTGLSELDIQQANKMYNCSTATASPVQSDTDHIVLPSSSDQEREEDYFFIRRKQYCLTSVSFSAAKEGVREGEADSDAVRLALCNASAPRQRWLWSKNHQILNGESFLCLAGNGTAAVVLQPCDLDATAQQWRCAGSFLVQPSTGHCLTFDYAALSPISSFEEALEQALVEGKPPAVTLQPCNAKRDHQKWNAQINASEGAHSEVCSRAPENNVAQCETQRMHSGGAMGWITCNSLGYYVQGIAIDREENLSGIHCCSTSHVFTGRLDGPVAITSEDCRVVETRGEKRSFKCPRGMLLKGFYFLGANLGAKFVKCCRPGSGSQPRYVQCFTDSLDSRSTDGERLTCRLPGYSITAMGSTKCSRGYRTNEAKCCY